MMLKILIIDIAPQTRESSYMLVKADTSLKFKEVSVALNEEETKGEGDSQFMKPYFKNELLDNFVDSYIELYRCNYLDYNIYDMKNGKANIFINCGTPKNIVYDYHNKIQIDMPDIIKDYSKFQEKERKLLELKYPKFHVDNLNFDETVYDIAANELVGYYSSDEYGSATYHINYNEIPNLLDFEMQYDDAYENEIFTLDRDKKAVAFTYDDGPSTYDLELADILIASHSTATFFMVGNRIANFPKSVEKLVKTGMDIGNHTYDHKSLTSLSNTKIVEEITKTNDIFKNKTGLTMNTLRPSYGAVNKRVALETGMPIILWNIDTLDWKTRNADKIYNEIIDNAKDGDIVLMHSLYKTSVEATDRAIKELYKRGFQIVSVKDLAKLKGKTLTAGNTYMSIK